MQDQLNQLKHIKLKMEIEAKKPRVIIVNKLDPSIGNNWCSGCLLINGVLLSIKPHSRGVNFCAPGKGVSFHITSSTFGDGAYKKQDFPLYEAHIRDNPRLLKFDSDTNSNDCVRKANAKRVRTFNEGRVAEKREKAFIDCLNDNL